MKKKKTIAKNMVKPFDKTYLDKLKIAKIFGSKCELCTKKITLTKKRKINFTFHHYTYDPLVKKNPSNFALLHRKCHYSVEMAKKYSDKKWNKLSFLRRKSRS